MLTLVISTRPCDPLVLPNLSRHRESDPDDPGPNTMRLQLPGAGAVIEPLLLVSLGSPTLSSWIEVIVIVSPAAAVPFIVSVPSTVIVWMPLGLITTPGLIVRLAPVLIVSEPSST